ncbi:MAG: electron transfer flavoprotein subunit beta/FixA family protein [Syntrophomonadaceae bacterium]|nr:electron transfer flavoprotein subunit beta/FixA family protein [Syntrophomonadaceae bacterium]
MPDILCCYKWVADEAYIRSGSGGDLDLSMADYKISDYDKNAIEEAVLLAEQHGGTAAVITVGLPDDTKGIKDALSRGPEKAYFINDPAFVDLEPAQTASLLAAAIASPIPYDIIICGEGSSDLYAQQVGPRLAEKLGIPCLCYVQKVELNGSELIAHRKSDEGLEVVKVSLPVLLTVVPDINNPRLPGLRDTLAAGKKPVVEFTAEDLPSIDTAALATTATKAATIKRNSRLFDADAAGIEELVQELKNSGAIA